VSGPLWPPETLLAMIRAADLLMRRSERNPGLFWTRRVNRRLGAIITLFLLRTSTTPNVVSIAGFTAHLAGASFVIIAPVSPSIPLVIAVFLLWQLAFSLDCADGQLARARDMASPFGAWLDQILDFLGHTAVFGSLLLFAVRTFQPTASETAVLGTFLVSGNLLGLFASAQRNALLGTKPAVDPQSSRTYRFLVLGRHLTDYGASLALSSLGLVWPPLLLVALVLGPAIVAMSVAAQVAINWPREGAPKASRRDTTTSPRTRPGTRDADE
jgi:phosphatidylglycerophosphate synthase